MSKFKSKYEYKSRCDNNVKRFLPDDGVRSSDDCDISQKIKSLEMEGLKLRNQVEEILNETSENLSTRTSDTTMGSSITACDDSARHATRYSAVRAGDFGRSWPEPIYEESVHVKNEIQIDEYRHRLDQLQHKIKQDSYAHNLEKERLYNNNEELKRANFRLQSDIENQIKEFQETERNHHIMTERLRCNLSQLVSINKKQEETLIESGARLEELCGADSAMRAMDQLRDLLIDVDYYRRISHVKGDDVDCSSPDQLVALVDKCFKEYDSDLDKRSRKIKDLEDDIFQIKRTLTHDKEKSLHDLRNQLAYEEEQNNYLKQHINEINENADRELERLREENAMIKAKLDEDMSNATSLIDGLEQNLQELSNKNKKMLDSWSAEKKSFEKVLDSNEKQIATIRAERDQAVNQKSSLTAKLDATQNQLSDTETSLLQLQSEKYSLDKHIEIVKKQNKEMESSILSSKKNFENILKTVRSCGDGDNNVNNSYGDGDDSFVDDDNDEDSRGQIWKPKKYQIDEAIHLIKGLSKKEKDMDLKYDKIKVEYEMLEKKLEAVDLQRRKLEQSFKAQQLDIDSSKNENAHINSLIANRNAEIERLTAERDYYFQLLNDKTDEVATIKTEKHRLAALLEERCRLLETKGDSNQSNDLQRCHTSNNCSGKDQVLRDDRNRLITELKDTKKAYEELLTQRDDDSHNLVKIRQENWTLQTNLQNASKEYEERIVENRKLSMKLKEAESEIANLCRELQNYHGVKSRKHTSLEKKVAELVVEISSNKKELKIAHERIKYLEKGVSKSSSKNPQSSILNSRSVVPQDEDNLKEANHRLSSLEQQMLTLDNNHSNLRDENFKLTDLLKKVTSQNERMSEELETYVEENKRLRKEISVFDTQKLYGRTKSERIPKKSKEQGNYSTDKRPKHYIESPLDNNDMSNDESLKQLRQDLQGSIKEAKRLLSSTPLIDSNDDNAVPSKHSDYTNFSQRSSKNQDSSCSNNNNLEKMSSSEPVDSSTVNTRRSESTSLTEADRYIYLPLNKSKESEYNYSDDEKATSAVQDLLSTNTNKPSIPVNKSKRDSYMLEEKIKRLLATEG